MKNFQPSSPKHYEDKKRIMQQAEQLGLESVTISDVAFYSATLSPRSIKKRASKAQQLMQAVQMSRDNTSLSPDLASTAYPGKPQQK